MKNHWQLQDAKARFSQLMKRVRSDGPQIITYRGADAAVVLSIEDYRKLNGDTVSFRERLLSGPILADEFVDAITQRTQDLGRDIGF